jgi:hypothetical protein
MYIIYYQNCSSFHISFPPLFTSVLSPNKKKFSSVCQPVLKQIQRAIPSYPNRALACPFPVWKTITIGGKSPHDLYGGLERKECIGSLERFDVKALMLGEPETWPHIKNPDWKRTDAHCQLFFNIEPGHLFHLINCFVRSCSPQSRVVSLR